MAMAGRHTTAAVWCLIVLYVGSFPASAAPLPDEERNEAFLTVGTFWSILVSIGFFSLALVCCAFLKRKLGFKNTEEEDRTIAKDLQAQLDEEEPLLPSESVDQKRDDLFLSLWTEARNLYERRTSKPSSSSTGLPQPLLSSSAAQFSLECTKADEHGCLIWQGPFAGGADALLAEARGRTILVGPCGVGKSTLWKWIATRWLKGDCQALHSFDLLLWLDAGSLSRYESLGEAIRENLYPSLPTDRSDELFNALCARQDRLLFLLDWETSSTGRPGRANVSTELRAACAGLLSGSTLPRCTLLLASRPGVQVPWLSVTEPTRLTGFSWKGVEQQVKSAFGVVEKKDEEKDTTKAGAAGEEEGNQEDVPKEEGGAVGKEEGKDEIIAKQLLKEIEERPLLKRAVCHPPHLLHLCWYWKLVAELEDEKRKFPDTSTEIYQYLLMELASCSSETDEDESGQKEKVLQALSSLAFTSWTEVPALMSEDDVQKSGIDLTKALASGLLQAQSERRLTFAHSALSDFLTARHAARNTSSPNSPISVLTAHLSNPETVLNSWRLLVLTAGQGIEPAAAILNHIAVTANSLPTTGNKNTADEHSVTLTRDLVFLALSAFEEAMHKVDDQDECEDKLQTAMKAVFSKRTLHLLQCDIISPPISRQLLMLSRRARSVLPSLGTLQLYLGYGPLGEVKKPEEKKEKNDKPVSEADSADAEGAKEAEREKVENERRKLAEQIQEGSRVTSALSGCQAVKLNLGASCCEAHLQLLAPELVERVNSVSISSAVGSQGPPLLAKMSALEKIEVVGKQAQSPFSEAEPLLSAVRQHPALSHITLTQLTLGDTGLADHLKALPTVNSLSLREMILGPRGLDGLMADLSALSNLEELDLSGTRCSGRGIPDQAGEQKEDNMEVKGLNCLSKLQNIKTLNFSCCQLHTSQLASLVSSISSFQKLQKLDLSWNSLAGVFSPLMRDLSSLPHLHCLILSGCQIHRSDIQALATVLPNMLNLDQLDLSENNLSDCFTMFVQQLTLCNLQMLGFENCQLTDTDIAAFGQTIEDSHLKCLRVLNVSGNPEVSPTAWKGFFKMLNQTGLPTLAELNLAQGHMRAASSARGTQDDMFQALLKMAERLITLCHVNTDGWEVSPNVLSELETALANNSEESATVHSM